MPAWWLPRRSWIICPRVPKRGLWRMRLAANSPSVPPPATVIRRVNRFTTDADGFDRALGALADLEGGTRPLYDALRIAIDYTAQHAATANRSVLVLAVGDDEGSAHSLDEAIELAIQRGVAIHAVGLSPAATPLTQLAARTGGSISGTTAAPRLVSYYGALGSVLSGSAPFYRTTWELNIVGGNFRLYSGYWIRASVAISTPEGTLYVPFRLDFE